MPVGNPKPQTVATRKYEQKTGWISKSYKLKKDVVEEYSAACKKAGVSAAGRRHLGEIPGAFAIWKNDR